MCAADANTVTINITTASFCLILCSLLTIFSCIFWLASIFYIVVLFSWF